jgi:hypothetical protein
VRHFKENARLHMVLTVIVKQYNMEDYCVVTMLRRISATNGEGCHNGCLSTDVFMLRPKHFSRYLHWISKSLRKYPVRCFSGQSFEMMSHSRATS